jgi:hypothetical protein
MSVRLQGDPLPVMASQVMPLHSSGRPGNFDGNTDNLAPAITEKPIHNRSSPSVLPPLIVRTITAIIIIIIIVVLPAKRLNLEFFHELFFTVRYDLGLLPFHV